MRSEPIPRRIRACTQGVGSQLHKSLKFVRRAVYWGPRMQKQRVIRLAGLLAGIWLMLLGDSALRGADILPPGFRPLPLGTHALVGGKVIPKPGETLDGGVIVIRDGRIKEVGKGITPPEDARIWDLHGSVIYAGF